MGNGWKNVVIIRAIDCEGGKKILERGKNTEGAKRSGSYSGAASVSGVRV